MNDRVVLEVLREPTSDAEADVTKYWNLVQRTEREVARGMKISEDTALRLEEPLMPL